MFGLALEELSEVDYIETFEEFKVGIDKDFITHYKTFQIDYRNGWINKNFIVRPGVGGSRC